MDDSEPKSSTSVNKQQIKRAAGNIFLYCVINTGLMKSVFRLDEPEKLYIAKAYYPLGFHIMSLDLKIISSTVSRSQDWAEHFCTTSHDQCEARSGLSQSQKSYFHLLDELLRRHSRKGAKTGEPLVVYVVYGAKTGELLVVYVVYAQFVLIPRQELMSIVKCHRESQSSENERLLC